ncbi:hypothetical protein LCGC14_1635040 [marine sediment metagenome]|uniref:HNH nuclease domain-containing protein n=1 Tax=marine sediment metagenome TaxID=412755 RepID=A0A0F9KH21_9ZZZZ
MEIWREVIGYEGWYEVSDQGHVRNLRTKKVLAANASAHKRPYYSVTLIRHGHHRKASIHRLVLAAFVGPPPDGYVTNHENGDKRDNRVENLEWVTQRRNVEHAYEHRLRPVGEAHHKAKLTEKQVREIRASGWTPQNHPRKAVSSPKLARKYGVSHPTIQAVLRGTTWRHLL